jgi:aromatic ring-cleaving dioxygenase
MQQNAPFHAHIYYTLLTREAARGLHTRLRDTVKAEGGTGLLYVGEMCDGPVGPHPQPQWEIHFYETYLPQLMPLLESCGFTVLVHPVTLDDLADHTSLARWIGKPIPLDVTALDPPGINKGLDRFGKADF